MDNEEEWKEREDRKEGGSKVREEEEERMIENNLPLGAVMKQSLFSGLSPPLVKTLISTI